MLSRNDQIEGGTMSVMKNAAIKSYEIRVTSKMATIDKLVDEARVSVVEGKWDDATNFLNGIETEASEAAEVAQELAWHTEEINVEDDEGDSISQRLGEIDYDDEKAEDK
jgi:hypothetical protein